MQVISAEIERTENVMVKFEFIFIEADQAIFTKLLDTMFKFENDGALVFDKIIPLMGGFHVMCMVKTIYDFLKNAGIVQLFALPGLGRVGTIIKTLKGGNINLYSTNVSLLYPLKT